MRTGLAILACTALASPALADETDEPTIVVMAPGGAVDADEVQALNAGAITGGTRPDLAAALARDVPGVSVAEAQGNPWAAAINWRGYSVSALQGTEQGMAVYLDGIRFNQPFGDTLLLDILPEAALVRAELREASPVFGRNALGGALLLATATGRDLPGVQGSASIDTSGGYGGTVSWGGKSALVMVEGIKDKGWRDHSPSRLWRGFASAGFEGDGWGIDARLMGADTKLTGNGVAPVELLAADYDAVFTRPDITWTRFGRITLLPHVEVGATGRIEGTLHYQALNRRSVNGDLADFAPCDADAAFLCLGDNDGGFTDPLRYVDRGGAVATDPGIDNYAVQNRGHERTRGGGLGLQWLDERETDIGTRRLAIGMAWESYRTRFAALSELGELLPDRSVVGIGGSMASDSAGITPVSVTTKLRDLALFATAGVPLLPWLSAEMGVRWSENRVTLADRLGTALNGKHRFRRASPSVEFDIRPADGWSMSLGFAETSRNPTPAELSCADAEAPCALANFFVADPPLKTVVARNWRAETEYAKGPLTVRFGLWRSDSRNDIRHIASDVRGRAYFANLGKSRRQGLDLSAVWQAGPWRIGADYTFTDATFRAPFAVSSPANPAADEDGLIAVERGDRLPGVPRNTGNLRLGYEGGKWGVETAARLRSGQILFGDEGNDNARTRGYAVFDMTGHVALTPQLRLVVEARNIFDKRYATFGTFSEVDDIALAEAPGAQNPRAYAPGMPRRVSAALKFAF